MGLFMMESEKSSEQRLPSARKKLTATIVPATSLTEASVKEMYGLFDASYAEVEEQIFRDDLAAKSHVITIRDEADVLRGFSTIVLLELVHEGQPAKFLFSGDTVIDPAYWGDRALPIKWMEALGAVHALDPDVPSYWLLTSMSPRTFKSLPMSFYDFHPRAQSDGSMSGLADAVGRTFFPDRFDAARGVIVGGPMTGRLKENLASVHEKELRLPDVRAFLERNPNFASGDELVCLAPLVPDNVRPWLRRCFLRGMENKAMLS